MANKSRILYLSRFGFVASILYSIPLIFFLKDRRFSDTWLLYLGSAIFLMCLFVFGTMYTGKKNKEAYKNYNGFTVTILGVIFSCILILLLTLFLAPDVFGLGSANSVLKQTPPAIATTGNQGILFVMLADALIVNFCAGMFAAVMTKGKSEENKLPPNE